MNYSYKIYKKISCFIFVKDRKNMKNTSFYNKTKKLKILKKRKEKGISNIPKNK